MSDPTRTDAKDNRKPITEMTESELEQFFRDNRGEIQFDVAESETFNSKYASLPRLSAEQ